MSTLRSPVLPPALSAAFLLTLPFCLAAQVQGQVTDSAAVAAVVHAFHEAL